MTQYNLSMDTWPIIMPGLIMGFGLGSAMVPATTLAFATLAPAEFNEPRHFMRWYAILATA